MCAKLTVLMPAYNAGRYIREAVDSVLAQRYADFDFLVVDDGSADDTAAILSTYRDPRMTVVRQANKGLVATLNESLERIRTPYVARFDADDVCLPERLATQLEFLERHPDYVLVGSDADYMDSDGSFLFRFFNKGYTDAGIRALEFRQCPFIHSSVLFRREAVQRAGGYNPGALTFEDHLLWTRLAEQGKMRNLDQALIKVRFNPESATVDERWRGPEFNAIKQRSIRQGDVTPEDAARLREILAGQDFSTFRQAAYHSMIGKKYLWNRHDPERARSHLRQARALMPRKAEPYLLYLLSFLPKKMIEGLYRRIKGDTE